MNNKFKITSIFLFSVSILLVVRMVIDTVNAHQYYYQHPFENSAPFSLYVLPKVVSCIIPAILGLILGLVFRKKANKQ
jgi:hypothetical protein